MRVFISYQHRDAAWAEWMAWNLEEQGHDVVVQAWDFTPGSNFVVEMQRALSTADKVVGVLSQNFLSSPYATAEWSAAFASDPIGANRRFVPVRIGPCRLEGLLGQIVFVDLVGLEEKQAVATLCAAIDGNRRKPTHLPAYPPGMSTAAIASDVNVSLADDEWYFSDLPPRSPSLMQLLSPPASPAEGCKIWRAHLNGPLAADLGIDRDGGPVQLDLAADGPFGTIVGSSGSGTSELLRTLICSFSTKYSPERIRFHLVDQKGGGTWHAVRGLPHIANVITFGPFDHQTQEFAGFANDLLTRKERTIGRTGAADVGAFNALHPASRLPVDIILVDEMFGDPDLAAALMLLQQRGRALGVSVIAASQRVENLPRPILDMARFGIFMGSFGLDRIVETPLFHPLRVSMPRTRASNPPPGRAIFARTSGLQFFQAGYMGGWSPGLDDSLYLSSIMVEKLSSILRAAALPQRED